MVPHQKRTSFQWNGRRKIHFKSLLRFSTHQLFCVGRITKEDRKDAAQPRQQLKSSSNRNERRSNSTDRTPASTTNTPPTTTTAKNRQAHHDVDESDRNHAPPQYSDAVRLPNINPSSHSTSSPKTTNSTTEQTGIL